VVRPYWQHEFDLDLVARLAVDANSVASDTLAGLIRDRMLEHQGLKERIDLERFPRCIRLEYADDFHLDVVCACPCYAPPKIWIPEKPAQRQDSSHAASWKLNDPFGYAEWFEQRTEVGHAHEGALAKSIAPPPPYEIAEAKAPLRKFVQLIKLRRNQYYKPLDAPSSILLTTMAGQVYAGQDFTLDGLALVVTAMSTWADNEGDALCVMNPTIPTEDFAGSLNSTEKRELRVFLQTYRNELATLAQVKGLDEQARSLGAMFGASPIDRALQTLANSVNSARHASSTSRLYTGREAATLGIALTTTSVTLPKPNPSHTFFGD
jgi:hypothetical protein